MNSATSAAQRGSDQHRAGQVEPQVGPDLELQQAEGVGARAEKRAVPEGGQAGETQQQVVAQREQHPDHDFQGQVLVQPDAAHPQRCGQQHQQCGEHR
jgi:hypothetical protein